MTAATVRKLLLMAVLAGAGGCSWGGDFPFFWKRGDTFDPGTAAQQRGQAQRWDPYPEPDSGPQMLGTRPPDFQVPPAEPTRGRDDSRWFWSR